MKSKTVLQVSIVENIRWKELGLLFAVWITILALEIGKVGTLYKLFLAKIEFFNSCIGLHCST